MTQAQFHPHLDADFEKICGIFQKRLEAYREYEPRGGDGEYPDNLAWWSAEFAALAAPECDCGPMPPPPVPTPAQVHQTPGLMVSGTVPSPPQPETVCVVPVAGNRPLVARRGNGDSIDVG